MTTMTTTERSDRYYEMVSGLEAEFGELLPESYGFLARVDEIASDREGSREWHEYLDRLFERDPDDEEWLLDHAEACEW